jgi:hypothetical protein
MFNSTQKGATMSDIQVLVVKPGRKKVVLTAHNPATLNAIMFKCQREGWNFQIQNGLDLVWVSNCLLNWVEQDEEIL